MTERNKPVASSAQSRRRLGSRAALFGGFGALLILMALICIDSLHTLGAFETDNTQIRQNFLYRERTLEQVLSGSRPKLSLAPIVSSASANSALLNSTRAAPDTRQSSSPSISGRSRVSGPTSVSTAIPFATDAVQSSTPAGSV